jgi:hypothetical protein
MMTEFEKVTEGPDGWSDWQYPTVNYQMKCCGCGLVHEMEYRAFIESDRDELQGTFKAIPLPHPIRVMYRARRQTP